jgi:two-component system chemotaxis response regulator CheY
MPLQYNYQITEQELMTPEQMVILIVDDMKTVRIKLKLICKELGFTHLHEAADGAQALEILNGVAVDLVLSDWNMPNMTGIEMLEKMRANPATIKTPVIFITAESDMSSVMSSLIKGVTDYIVKPFPPNTVKQKIVQILNLNPDLLKL